MTTATTEYVALPTGDLRVTISAAPVRTRRNGRWVPVDLTMVRGEDGSVAPVAHPNGLRVSGAVGAGTHDLASVGTVPGRIALTWDGILPEPVISAERATYPEVLPGVDLVVAATRTGFAQTLVVKDRAAVDRVATVRFGLKGPIAAHTTDPAGNLTLKGTAGKGKDAAGKGTAGTDIATIAALRMWDARTMDETGSVPTGSVPIATAVERAADGLTLVLTPDLAWMRAPETVFPVTLDPTVTPVATTFDTYVRQTETTDRSAKPDLQLGLLATTPPTLTRSFLTWDASMLVGKQITAATVSFFSFWSDTCDARGWKIWTATAASTSSRWDSKPALLNEEAESTATTGGTNCADAWVSIDGKSFFQRAASAGTLLASMGITASDEADRTGFKQFRSKEATSSAQVPKAEVTYNAWPTITSRSTVPASACTTGPGRPMLNTLTPQLRAGVADGDTPSLSVTFEWWPVGAGQALGSATVDGIAPGSTASTTVPAGALIDGGTYQWRVRASDGVTGSAVWSSFCEITVYVTAPPVEGCTGGTNIPVPSDFNGDKVRDLAIADPEASVDGSNKAGNVRIVDGATGAVRTITGNTAKAGTSVAAGDQLGYAIAPYDVNHDGCTDLAVGIPFRDINGATDAGMVIVLLGAPAGLTSGPASLTCYQGHSGTPDSPETDDWFGSAIAAGQTPAGEGYLVIGVPGEDLGSATDTGLIHYLRGTVNVTLDQSTGGTNATDDRFGSSVAASPNHLAIGRPGETVDGQTFAGAVSVFTNTAGTQAPTLVANINQNSAATSQTAETGDQMGTSVALAPYRSSETATGESVLLVGVPGEDLAVSGQPTVVDAGIAMRFIVSPNGVTQQEDISRATTGVDGALGDGDYFGQRVLAVNLAPGQVSTQTNIKILVGAPGVDIEGVADEGVVHVFDLCPEPGTSDVLIRRGPGGAGLPGTAATTDLLGLSMMADTGNLYVASPYGQPAVYALTWTDLAVGTVRVAATWTPGTGGLPADQWAFGAAIG